MAKRDAPEPDLPVSDGGVHIKITYSTHLDIDLVECGGTTNGIDVTINDGDAWTITTQDAERIAEAFKTACYSREGRE